MSYACRPLTFPLLTYVRLNAMQKTALEFYSMASSGEGDHVTVGELFVFLAEFPEIIAGIYNAGLATTKDTRRTKYAGAKCFHEAVQLMSRPPKVQDFIESKEVKELEEKTVGFSTRPKTAKVWRASKARERNWKAMDAVNANPVFPRATRSPFDPKVVRGVPSRAVCGVVCLKFYYFLYHSQSM